MSNDDFPRGDAPLPVEPPAPDVTPPAKPAEPDAAFGRGEGVGQALEVEGLSQGQIVWGRFIRHRGAIFGVVTISLIALLSFSAMGFGPIRGWWQYQDYLASNANIENGAAPTLTMPTWLGGPGFAIGNHPFGQDTIGRDNFALVMKGIQTSLLVMFVLGLVTLLIGVTVGALAGYYRGWIDTVLMRVTDLVITLPVIVLGAVLGRLVNTLPVKMNASQEVVDAIRIDRKSVV